MVAELPLDVERNVSGGEAGLPVHGLPAPVDVEERGLLLLLPRVRVPAQAVVSMAEPTALKARLRHKVNSGSQLRKIFGCFEN